MIGWDSAKKTPKACMVLGLFFCLRKSVADIAVLQTGKAIAIRTFFMKENVCILGYFRKIARCLFCRYKESQWMGVLE